MVGHGLQPLVRSLTLGRRSNEEVLMDAALLSALADLLWPITALILLVVIYRPVSRMIGQISNRGGTLKIGEFELSLPEIAQQQQVSISDLQAQVAELKKAVETNSAAAGTKSIIAETKSATTRAGKRILWVDDHPENNGSLQAALADQGFEIQNALTTESAFQLFSPSTFDFIISDMQRGMDRSAGLNLARSIKQKDPAQKFVIYCGFDNAKRLAGSERENNVDLITASPIELMSFLKAEHGAKV
jgi:PleD family two-component response regulator